MDSLQVMAGRIHENQELLLGQREPVCIHGFQLELRKRPGARNKVSDANLEVIRIYSGLTDHDNVK